MFICKIPYFLVSLDGAVELFVKPTERRVVAIVGVLPFTLSIDGLEIRRFCAANNFDDAVAVLVVVVDEAGAFLVIDGVRVAAFDKVRRVKDKRPIADGPRSVELVAVELVRLMVDVGPIGPQRLARRTNAADLLAKRSKNIFRIGYKIYESIVWMRTERKNC